MRMGKKTKVTREVTRQERNRKNNLWRIGISAIAAVIIFIALIVIESSILNQEQKILVYQIAHDVEAGTKLTEENINKFVREKEVQVSLIPENYITDKSVMLGKFINRNYKERDIITTDGITDTEGAYKNSIKNPVEVSFSAGDLASSVAGKIREGDYVNIYGLRRREVAVDGAYTVSMESRYMVDDLFTFRHVYIAKAYDGGGTRLKSDTDPSGEGNESTSLFTVILAEEDAELFTEMLRNAEIRLSKLVYDTNEDYRVFVTRNNSSTGSTISTLPVGSTPYMDSYRNSTDDTNDVNGTPETTETGTEGSTEGTNNGESTSEATSESTSEEQSSEPESEDTAG